MENFTTNVKELMAQAAERESMGITPEVKKQLDFIDNTIEGKPLTPAESKFIEDMKTRIKQYKELTKKQSDYLGTLLLKYSRMTKK
jgi:hypothetical protein